MRSADNNALFFCHLALMSRNCTLLQGLSAALLPRWSSSGGGTRPGAGSSFPLLPGPGPDHAAILLSPPSWWSQGRCATRSHPASCFHLPAAACELELATWTSWAVSQWPLEYPCVYTFTFQQGENTMPSSYRQELLKTSFATRRTETPPAPPTANHTKTY